MSPKNNYYYTITLNLPNNGTEKHHRLKMRDTIDIIEQHLKNVYDIEYNITRNHVYNCLKNRGINKQICDKFKVCHYIEQ